MRLVGPGMPLGAGSFSSAYSPKWPECLHRCLIAFLEVRIHTRSQFFARRHLTLLDTGMNVFLFANVMVSGISLASDLDIHSRRVKFILAMSIAVGVSQI